MPALQGYAEVTHGVNKVMTFKIFLTVVFISTGLFCSWAAAIEETGHSNRVTGPLRVSDEPRGSCGQCHTEKSAARYYPKSLWRENDNELCFTCHIDINNSGIYPGRQIYENSNHANDPRFAWPGPVPPPRRDRAMGKCINCHNAHGRNDELGLIPNLLNVREERLCLTCHDGSPALRNIAKDINKPFGHPVRLAAGKHGADEGGDPARFSYTNGNRHAECSDCHNAHAAYGDPLPPRAPNASNRNTRVSRVRVFNGVGGVTPAYEFRSAFDTGSPVLEYEICFKCHSSWTRQPPGQQDMALLFNTNNASFHPVEGQGKNPAIDTASFVAGKNPFSTIFCSDCHGSEDMSSKGPHGSIFPNILRRFYDAQSTRRNVTRNELCFLCHNFDTYANPAGLFQRSSRFNPPLSPNGHAFHVGQKQIPCYACHDSHGSPQFPALITTGRNPGLINFGLTVNRGSCLPTCHGSRVYIQNYPR